MINKGTIFQLPYESGYGRFCRYLAANLGTDTSTAGIDRMTNLAFGKHVIRAPRGLLERAYQTSCLLSLHEAAGESGIELPGYHLNNGYRPLVHCPECSRSNFHTSIFDLDWVTICPLHRTKLQRLCPDCDGKWLLGTELTSQSCITCSANTPFSKWIDQKIQNPTAHKKAFSAHFNLVKLLSSNLFPSVEIDGINRHGIPTVTHLNSSVKLKVSGLRSFGLMPDELIDFFSEAAPDIAPIEFCQLDMKKLVTFNEQQLNLKRPYAKVNFEMLRKQTKINFEAMLDDKHSLGTCCDEPELCTLCAAWTIWQRIYSCDYRLDWYTNLKNWNSVYVDLHSFRGYMTAPTSIGHIARINSHQVILPNDVVNQINCIEAVHLLINVYVHLQKHEEYVELNPSKCPKAYRELIRKLSTSEELKKPTYGVTMQGTKLRFFWLVPNLSFLEAGKK